MNQQNNELSPKDGFIVVADSKQAYNDELIIKKLYQPIMGIVARGLYDELSLRIQPRMNLAARRMNKDLQLALNVGVGSLVQARNRLEALGLLRTYTLTDEIGVLTIYEIKPPLTATAFFSDDILSSLLLSLIGETQYQELKDEFLYQKEIPANAQEITKTLLEVYLPDFTIPVAKNNSVKATLTEPLVQQTLADVLDEAYFVSLLQKSFVDQRDVLAHKADLVNLCLLYRLDELQLMTLLEQNCDVITNQVDYAAAKKQAYREFEMKLNPQTEQVATQEESTAVQTTPPTPPAKGSGGNAELLIAACNGMTPIEFLTDIKRQKGSFVTKNERIFIEDMVRRNVLPNSVLNALIHYALIVQKHNLLKVSFLEAIAVDWAQNKIKTPSEAFSYVRKRNQKQKEKAEQRKKALPKYYNGRPVVQKEKLPEWAKEEQKNPPRDLEKEAILKIKIAEQEKIAAENKRKFKERKRKEAEERRKARKW
ncbi:DnaD domain protein [Ligilactobacillus ceti]|uniref:Chromosome replication initiation membrane attachment protein n=1 Tax=Ligilactobacillus ceti DSM 22408 TaxID=1122146 RepID=A0A0R2KGP4_9LACO|nr:DnaD domain protein [Ligilactobacillus ceti]KRN88526.1 chromosome replication initiation membrane attachment protein [Ligilactobacillus ceti DSM 22408]